MDELEDRVRRGLQHPSMSAEATEILADVHRGVRNRQQRRLAVGAAGVLAVLTATGVLTGTSTGPDGSKDMATGPTSSPSETSATTRPATPDAESLTGTTGFDVATSGVFWLSTSTCGEQPCSVLHRAEPGGGAEVVHTFAFDTPASANRDELPPVESVRVSDDGRDLWVYPGWNSGLSGDGSQLWTSHDGGVQWARQDLGGNPKDRLEVEPVGDQVFALQSLPSRVWRSPAGSDDWVPVPLPEGYGYADQLTSLGNSVVVSAMKDDRRMVLTLTASGGSWHWREVEAPCQGEVGAIRGTGTALLAPCPGDGKLRRRPGGRVAQRGRRHVEAVRGGEPLVVRRQRLPDRRRLGVRRHRRGRPDRHRDRPGAGGAAAGQERRLSLREFTDAERGYLLVTSPSTLLATEDGGHTWHRFE